MTQQPAPQTPPGAAWYRPGLPDVIFLLVMLAGIRGSQHTYLDDPGLGWHLRNLDAMWEQGRWLSSDPFTDPRDGQPPRWFTNQWLGELPFYLGWKWAGAEGIAVANGLILALLARWLYATFLRDGLNWPMAFVWTVIGLMGTSCSWNARPNLFSILFVFFTADVCIRLHEGTASRRSCLLLLLVFALWANTHGGFLAGLITLGATLMIELALTLAAGDPSLRPQARQRLLRIGLLTAGACLATLINPYGIDLYRWTFQLLGDPYFMELHQEWRSPDFRSAGAFRYEVIVLLFPLILAITTRRLSIVEWVLAILWLHFALTGFRYVALWVVVVVPILARCSMEIPYLRELARRWQVTDQPGSLFHTPAQRPGWLWSGVLVLGAIGWARSAQGTFAVHKQEIIASRALDELIALARKQRQKTGKRPVIVHSYDWGGYVTWHGWPELLNWIDDRNEVQGRARIEEYFALMSAQPGWEEKLLRADFVCIKPDAPLVVALRKSGAWNEPYADDYAVLFARR